MSKDECSLSGFITNDELSAFQKSVSGGASFLEALDLLAKTNKVLSQALKVRECAARFISDQKIYCAETIHQSDRVIVNAYEFIQDVADIVGYLDDEE